MIKSSAKRFSKGCNKIFFSNIMKQKKEYDDSWRWTADLIVKYAPKIMTNEASIEKNEWLMSSDIGKIYDGKRFTREEYLRRKINTCGL